uniref:non-specific serine/threonine protein kinase n=1 Tax=Oryza glumipatula TaxID=40148 RepID=A0A0D9ZG93_9ORYZ
MPSLYIFLGLLLFSLQAPPCPAATDTLKAGQVLSAGDKLVSRNGKFALGFFNPSTNISKSSDNISSSWYIGIWFNKIPVFTVVWVANRERSIAEPDLKLTQLKISQDGNLAIVNHANESIIWSTRIVNRTEASMNTSVLLHDSGNLVIQSTSNAVLWQSFDYPTDVALPNAKIGWNKVTGLNRVGVSKKSLIDMGPGSYSVQLYTNGTRRVTLEHRNPSIEYWYWSPDESGMKIPALKQLLYMNPQTRGLVTPAYVNSSEEEYYSYNSSDESSSTFLLLDINGQIKFNVWSQDKQSWQSLYTQPVDPCRSYDTCGPFTICNGNSQPFCDCMENFTRKSPRDWDLGDRTGGCSRISPLDCTRNTSSTDIFHPLIHVTLPRNPQTIQEATTQSECAQACLSSCSCTAYSYQNTSTCSIWHDELFSVNQDDGIEIHSQDVLYLRLAAKDLQSLRNNKRKPNVAVVIAASVIGFVLLMVGMFLLIWRNRFEWCGAPLHDGEDSSGIKAFRYNDLVHATKNFSEKLGAGGFGSVFKGMLIDLTTIAVKRLDGDRQGEKQFRAEVSSIGLIQHINLVKLIGFCCEGRKRLLVYEHMLNGSLDAHLFQSNAGTLNWSIRYHIALGVARGLAYLHQSCHECIIHCDIKPQNILLDASFAPKIADFGMAAFVGRDFSRILTTFRGTVGYLAPEWISGVAVTPKVDVYSFGMVLLEIISGRRNSPNEYTSDNYHVSYFPVQAINKLHEGDVRNLVDPQLCDDFSLEEAERVCKVACWCIQDDEHDRPTMSEVVRVLEGIQELEMPPMPRLLAALTKCSDVAGADEIVNVHADDQPRSSAHRKLPAILVSMRPQSYAFLGLVLLLFSLLPLAPCSAANLNNDTLLAGQALAVGDKLISNNGKFTLGFFQPDAGTTKDLQSLSKSKRKPIVGVVTTVSIISLVLLIMLMVLVMVWRNRFKWCGVPLHSSQGSSGIIAFRYSDLDHATKNFSEKLGEGGFGSVFKGVLRDLTVVAVKRLDGARQGEKQFRAEVSSIGLIQHINLVKLIGFCCQSDKRLLVYEHMLNGSLDTHLFQSNATILKWSTRYQITIGVARGLSYLHQSCHECIIHCDIKPQNILLDESFTPKIADFGMAVFVGRDFSRVLTTFRGTVGYLAPEWLSGVAITPKVDVYSYGIVLLEIISGMRSLPNVHSSNSHHAAYFPVQAISKLHEGDVQSLVDPRLSGDFNLEEAERVCKVACWCIQDNEFDRPTMGEVVLVLEGLQEFDMPPMPRLLAAITRSSNVAEM